MDRLDADVSPLSVTGSKRVRPVGSAAFQSELSSRVPIIVNQAERRPPSAPANTIQKNIACMRTAGLDGVRKPVLAVVVRLKADAPGIHRNSAVVEGHEMRKVRVAAKYRGSGTAKAGSDRGRSGETDAGSRHIFEKVIEIAVRCAVAEQNIVEHRYCRRQ